MLLEEAHHFRPRIRSVLGFCETVAFVLIAQVLDLATASAKRRDDLLGLLDGHARIVRAMNDHERRLDAVYEV